MSSKLAGLVGLKGQIINSLGSGSFFIFIVEFGQVTKSSHDRNIDRNKIFA
jgi:hypothetical protein